MAMSGPGIGWYQTRWPKSSKIIGPALALPPLGAAKRSPGARPGWRVLITTAGGSRSGRGADAGRPPRPAWEDRAGGAQWAWLAPAPGAGHGDRPDLRRRAAAEADLRPRRGEVRVGRGIDAER